MCLPQEKKRRMSTRRQLQILPHLHTRASKKGTSDFFKTHPTPCVQSTCIRMASLPSKAPRLLGLCWWRAEQIVLQIAVLAGRALAYDFCSPRRLQFKKSDQCNSKTYTEVLVQQLAMPCQLASSAQSVFPRHGWLKQLDGGVTSQVH